MSEVAETNCRVRCHFFLTWLGIELPFHVHSSVTFSMFITFFDRACDNAGCSKSVSPNVVEESMKLASSVSLEHAEHLSSSAILSLSVLDPRLVPVKEAKCPFMGLKAEPVSKDGGSEASNSSCWEATADKMISFMDTWFEHERDCLVPDSKELWELSNKNLIPPMEESLLSAERHQRRLSFFFMDNKNQEICTTKSTNKSSRFCPILLLRNSQKDNSFVWYFFVPLLSPSFILCHVCK